MPLILRVMPLIPRIIFMTTNVRLMRLSGGPGRKLTPSR